MQTVDTVNIYQVEPPSQLGTISARVNPTIPPPGGWTVAVLEVPRLPGNGLDYSQKCYNKPGECYRLARLGF